MLQRREIVTGEVEPTDEECEWTSDREEEELAVSAAWCFFLQRFLRFMAHKSRQT